MENSNHQKFMRKAINLFQQNLNSLQGIGRILAGIALDDNFVDIQQYNLFGKEKMLKTPTEINL